MFLMESKTREISLVNLKKLNKCEQPYNEQNSRMESVPMT